MSWLTGYRRLNHRYERDPRNYLAFLGLAAAICCHKRLARQCAHSVNAPYSPPNLSNPARFALNPHPVVSC